MTPGVRARELVNCGSAGVSAALQSEGVTAEQAQKQRRLIFNQATA